MGAKKCSLGGTQLVGKVCTETAAAAYAKGYKAESCELERRGRSFHQGYWTATSEKRFHLN